MLLNIFYRCHHFESNDFWLAFACWLLENCSPPSDPFGKQASRSKKVENWPTCLQNMCWTRIWSSWTKSVRSDKLRFLHFSLYNKVHDIYTSRERIRARSWWVEQKGTHWSHSEYISFNDGELPTGTYIKEKITQLILNDIPFQALSIQISKGNNSKPQRRQIAFHLNMNKE